MRSSAVILGALALGSCATPDLGSSQSVDLVITGGLIVDGSGGEPFVGNVAIDDGRIVSVGMTDGLVAERVIDADGLVVAPGFIDPHTHADEELDGSDRDDRSAAPWLFQGVTTLVTGNDGFGGYDISAKAARYRQQGVGPNVAMLVGLGPVRSEVIGEDDRVATPGEVTKMGALVGQAMCEGAFGFSAGLYYAPQSFVAFDPVVSLARVASAHGGYYDTHLRDEGDFSVGLLAALDEALSIGEEADIAVHLAHLKALGPAVWGQSAQIIERVEAARRAGRRVTADQYPWAASGTRVSTGLLPRWAQDGGEGAIRARLAAPSERERVREAVAGNIARRGGADRLLLTESLGDAGIEAGLTLAEQALRWRLTPPEAALRILDKGNARLASFNMDEGDIAAIARQPWVVTGSDGSSGHPRKYASFPKAYRDLVVNGDLSLADFVARSSARSADIIGLQDRGRLVPGMAADILVFDPKTFAPVADFTRPAEQSVGVIHMLIGGKAVISKGAWTGALPGAALLHPSSLSNICPSAEGATR